MFGYAGIIYQEGEWRIVKGPNRYQIRHEHGQGRLVPNNLDDISTFYNFGTDRPHEGWNDECSKCGAKPPSHIVTMRELLEM